MDLCLMIPNDETLLKLYFFSLPKHKNSCLLLDNGDVDVAATIHQDFRCVGSSQGCLAFTHKNSDKPFLHNTFSNTTITLPSAHTLPGSDRSRIQKLVLCGNPSHDDYTVLAMHNPLLQTRIAFCRLGDDNWTDLIGSEIQSCLDIVCCEDTKSAFALGLGPKVEVWDFSGAVPTRKTVIQGPCQTQLARDNDLFPGDLYTSHWYLALSEINELFLAVRYIGEYVRDDGTVVYERDVNMEVCPYKTVAFHVFKYRDIGDGKWVEVETLDNCTLFLGGNQSMMTRATDEESKRNAIYFTDDYCDRIDEDYSYGGHDMGIFNMEDGSIRPFLVSEQLRIAPPPMWCLSPVV